MISDININNRALFSLEKETPPYSTNQRIINLALPILHLYKPASVIISVGSCFSHIFHLKTGEWKENIGKIAFYVSSIALTILFPTGSVLFTYGIQLSIQVNELGKHIGKEEYKEGCFTLFKSAHTVVYLGAVFYATPIWLGLSLVSQGLVEIYAAFQEAKKIQNQKIQDFLPELLVSAFLGFIRIRKAKIYCEREWRNHFGKEVNQDDLKELFEEIDKLKQEKGKKKEELLQKISKYPFLLKISFVYEKIKFFIKGDETISFAEVLKSKGYSSKLRDLFFANYYFKSLKCSNLKFEHCKFDESLFQRSVFNNNVFNNCSLNNAVLIESVMENCLFHNSNLSSSVMNKGNFSNVHFINCNLNGAYFNEANFSKVVIKNSTLLETSFLFAKVLNSSLINCDLTDTLLCGTEKQFFIKGGLPNKITKPVIAFSSWQFGYGAPFAALARKGLKEFNMIPLFFETENEVLKEAINQETVQSLKEIRNSSIPVSSIPQEILQRARQGSQIEGIMKKAAEILHYADALYIPGGSDIAPELYGEVRTKETSPEKYYMRTIFEYAMVHEANKLQVPTFSVCRGSQIVATYFGSKLIQHVPNQMCVLQSLEVVCKNPKAVAFFEKLMGQREPLLGLSLHHQAVGSLGPSLIPLLVSSDGGVIKATIDENENFLSTQFHPEASFLDEKTFSLYTNGIPSELVSNNKNFFNFIYKKSLERRSMRLEAIA